MQSKSQKAEISDASEAQGVSGHSPKRVWLRIVGGGMTLPSGKSYITLVGDDRGLPKHIEYVRADLAADLVKALEGAEIAVAELCQDQNPANECWNILSEIRATLSSLKEGK